MKPSNRFEERGSRSRIGECEVLIPSEAYNATLADEKKALSLHKESPFSF